MYNSTHYGSRQGQNQDEQQAQYPIMGCVVPAGDTANQPGTYPVYSNPYGGTLPSYKNLHVFVQSFDYIGYTMQQAQQVGYQNQDFYSGSYQAQPFSQMMSPSTSTYTHDHATMTYPGHPLSGPYPQYVQHSDPVLVDPNYESSLLAVSRDLHSSGTSYLILLPQAALFMTCSTTIISWPD
jgi:hypothetical protein